jgi:hypothetical protein
MLSYAPAYRCFSLLEVFYNALSLPATGSIIMVDAWGSRLDIVWV